jgi:hypothetical protein
VCFSGASFWVGLIADYPTGFPYGESECSPRASDWKTEKKSVAFHCAGMASSQRRPFVREWCRHKIFETKKKKEKYDDDEG